MRMYRLSFYATVFLFMDLSNMFHIGFFYPNNIGQKHCFFFFQQNGKHHVIFREPFVSEPAMFERQEK